MLLGAVAHKRMKTEGGEMHFYCIKKVAGRPQGFFLEKFFFLKCLKTLYIPLTKPNKPYNAFFV